MKNSHIEWTDHTFNPWEGCTKVSPGCAHCYAESRNKRWAGGVNWGPGAPRRRTSAANWRQPMKWDREAATAGIRPRVFCASLADWLDDEVDVSWLADLLDLIKATPNLDWLLLTKRPQNWEKRMRQVMHGYHAGSLFAARWLDKNAPANVWVGTTVEDQVRADDRLPALLDIPARIRFLSCEPLLGPLDLWSYLDPINGGYVGRSFIDWIICGGESGPGARSMDETWALRLRDDCNEAAVPFFFKQWGEWRSGLRQGKKITGRDLAGREWSEFPKGAAA